jgi:hypothetical protein
MAKYVIRQQNTYFPQKRTHFRRTEKDRQKKTYFPQKKPYAILNVSTETEYGNPFGG